MIIIHAFFNVNPAFRKEFLEHVRLVVNPSQAEEGNISYDCYENPLQANQFVFLEKWKDEPAIQEHEKTAHFISFVKEVGKFVAEPFKAELFDASVKS